MDKFKKQAENLGSVRINNGQHAADVVRECDTNGAIVAHPIPFPSNQAGGAYGCHWLAMQPSNSCRTSDLGECGECPIHLFASMRRCGRTTRQISQRGFQVRMAAPE